eukprot:3932831-Rhodomonas_salina.2
MGWKSGSETPADWSLACACWNVGFRFRLTRRCGSRWTRTCAWCARIVVATPPPSPSAGPCVHAACMLRACLALTVGLSFSRVSLAVCFARALTLSHTLARSLARSLSHTTLSTSHPPCKREHLPANTNTARPSTLDTSTTHPRARSCRRRDERVPVKASELTHFPHAVLEVKLQV